jgi:hypothetical protein
MEGENRRAHDMNMDERIRGIAELIVRADKGEVTEKEFYTEHARLAEGMSPVEVFLRVQPVLWQLRGNAGSWFVLGAPSAGDLTAVKSSESKAPPETVTDC